MLDNKEKIKYLGVDWGEKRLGLAISEPGLNMAVPFGTVSSLAEVLELIKQEEISLVVLGYPQKLSGAESDNPLFLKFLEELKAQSPVPIELIDERLSSKAADSLPGEKKEKAGRDEIAAMLILEAYLEKKGL